MIDFLQIQLILVTVFMIIISQLRKVAKMDENFDHEDEHSLGDEFKISFLIAFLGDFDNYPFGSLFSEIIFQITIIIEAIVKITAR